MAEPTQPTDQPTLDSNLVNASQPDAGHRAGGWAANEIPSSQNFNWLFSTVASWVLYFYNLLSYWIGHNANEVLTITANAVEPAQANSTFQSAGGAINNAYTTNFKPGRVWVARGNGMHPVTLMHQTGGPGQFNLAGAANVVLSAVTDTVVFQLDGSGYWNEIWRGFGISPAPGGMVVKYAAGAFSWTAPQNISSVRVLKIGAGGGGGGANSSVNGGSGGSGAYQMDSEPVVPGAAYNGVVGAGGAAGSYNIDLGNPGGDGGNSYLTSASVAAKGGKGGSGGSAGAGGVGGTATLDATHFGIVGGNGVMHSITVKGATPLGYTQYGNGGLGGAPFGAPQSTAGQDGLVIIFY